jgi:exodeoxyribonuclease-3
MDHTEIQLLAWNVNGYNDKIHAYTKTLLTDIKPDLLFISETHLSKESMEKYLSDFQEYNRVINSHNPDKYHGVAMLIRKTHQYTEVPINLGIPARKDTNRGGPETGRIIAVKINGYTVVGTYTPNASRYLRHLPYRVAAWDVAFSELLKSYHKESPVILIGDINVAPESIDVSHPEVMCDKAGFTLAERRSYCEFMSYGWIDVWRLQNPDEVMYTWRGDHTPGHGMRLDNIIVSPCLRNKLGEAFIMDECKESDHIIVGLNIRL